MWNAETGMHLSSAYNCSKALEQTSIFSQINEELKLKNRHKLHLVNVFKCHLDVIFVIS